MKKIILRFLILALTLMSMSVVSFADGTVVPQTLTTWDGVLRDKNGDAYADNKVINNGYSFYSVAESVVSKALVARNNKVGTGVTHVKDGDNTYYSVNWEDVQSNYRTDIKPYMNSDAPVAAVSYKIQIPQESASKTRDFVLQFTNKPYDATTGVTTAKLTVKYDGKSFYAEPTSNLTAVTSEAVEYTPDSWTTVQVRLYLNAENKVEVGVYVGEQQIFYGTGVVDYSSNLTLLAMNFLSQVESSATYTTYLDDIKVETLSSDYIPTDIVDSVDGLTLWDGVLRDSNGNAYADNKVINNGYSFYSVAESVVSKALVARNNKVGTGVTHVKDGDNTYYSVNWEDVQSNYRTDIKPYMNSDAPVAAVSYKIQIPQESASKTRDFVLQFTNKPYDATTGVTTAKLTVKYDGKSFYAEPTSNLTAVTSEAVEYTPDSWTTVQVRLYLNAENKVEVGVYVGEQQIFYGTGVVDYSSNLTLLAMNFLSQVESGATYTTYLDDITVSLMPEEFKPVSMIKTTLEQNGDIVESKAEVSSIYNNLCLITAVYNSANKLEKIWVDDSIENGFLSSTVSGADYVKSGYKVKTFVFDSLQSAIPQVESIGLTID